MISAILLSAVLACGTVFVHMAGLSALHRFPDASRGRRPHILALLVLGLITLHVFESLIYAAGYWVGAGPLGLGGFDQMQSLTFMNLLYYSLVTYSSLGLGDAYPNGHLKFVTGIQAVNGFLLISCSASFLFMWMTGRGRADRRVSHG